MFFLTLCPSSAFLANKITQFHFFAQIRWWPPGSSRSGSDEPGSDSLDCQILCCFRATSDSPNSGNFVIYWRQQWIDKYSRPYDQRCFAFAAKETFMFWRAASISSSIFARSSPTLFFVGGHHDWNGKCFGEIIYRLFYSNIERTTARHLMQHIIVPKLHVDNHLLSQTEIRVYLSIVLCYV